MKRPLRTFVLVTGVLTALMLATRSWRNDTFECCATRAFGFPFPWRVEGCCGSESDLPTQALYWAGNVLLAAVGASAVTWFLWGRARRKGPRGEL